jgi:hypothetical protein
MENSGEEGTMIRASDREAAEISRSFDDSTVDLTEGNTTVKRKKRAKISSTTFIEENYVTNPNAASSSYSSQRVPINTAPEPPESLQTWGRARYSTAEEDAARKAAAAALHGLNQYIGTKRVTRPKIAASSSSSSSGASKVGKTRQKRTRKVKDAPLAIEPIPTRESSGRTKRKRYTEEEIDDELDWEELNSLKGSSSAPRRSSIPMKARKPRVDTSEFQGDADSENGYIIENTTNKSWTSTSSSKKLKGNEQHLKKREGHVVSIQAEQALPLSFGKSMKFSTHTIYLKKSARGVGLRVRVIDQRIVVRGFANWFDPSINIRSNDVIMAANAVDARLNNPNKMLKEFAWRDTSTSNEKRAVGLSMIEEVVCLRIARPHIYVDQESVDVMELDASTFLGQENININREIPTSSPPAVVLPHTSIPMETEEQHETTTVPTKATPIPTLTSIARSATPNTSLRTSIVPGMAKSVSPRILPKTKISIRKSNKI